MAIKKELILDFAGVLATNFSPFFWQELSEESKTSYEMLVQFKKEIREELWTGKVSEGEFWAQLCKQFPAIKRDKAKAILISNIKPLPAIREVATWSEYANIHIVSNHRIEWIQPIIKPIESYVRSITISSQVGYCKPESEIFTLVKMQLSNECNVLFVDDQEKNFKEAKELGWNTLLADENGNWIERIIPLISQLQT
ncbi:HAD-IA family hydrolase [Paenibacillus sp. N3.4]|uniref:HAD-IA family hydrolase n=1 Tax=Paenibacillus sp. N3.4 TaxID=2603222 RepID=UPI0011C7537A|nr:HAD-IA family hydrolase [Paenibacillus sp. N3.4]TXK84197.1 HAD-IA family hydrolase [Paenibacillus sp. N3.4]